MATFKVGDRVKRIAHPGYNANITGFHIGAVGTVIEIEDEGIVRVLSDSSPLPYGWGCYSFTLAPLTPPAEDTWAADKVKQVTKPQHIEPVAIPEWLTANVQ